MKIKIIVLSHFLFDAKMRELMLNDNNVEDTNSAFISIIGTEECIKYWIKEDDRHYFKDHPNVLNLEFDDIGTHVSYNGHLFKTMVIEQAEQTLEFIERMIKEGKDTFYIHCKAGVSRSRAFGEFLYRYCKENNIEVEYEDRDWYRTMLNTSILRKLIHAYWMKYKINQYAEGNFTEYAHDIINIPIKEINRDDGKD